jgi:hypothetical protein
VSELDAPVPMRLRNPMERWEDDGQDGVDVLADEVDDVFVVEVCLAASAMKGPATNDRTVKGPLGDLEVLGGEALCELAEQGPHNLLELDRLDDVEDLLDLVEVHDLLGGVNLGPVAEEAEDDVLGQGRVLLEELDDTVGELGVVEGEALDLVQGEEDAGEEGLVLLLQGQGKAVDDGAEDLEQLGDAVVPLGVVDELEEDVVDGAADEGAQVEELAVDPVQRRLEEVPLSRVLRVEQLQELCQNARISKGLQRRLPRTCRTNPVSM